jgi:hypothetical protein
MNKDGNISYSICNVKYTFEDILSVEYFQDNDIKKLVDDYLINLLFPDKEKLHSNEQEFEKFTYIIAECYAKILKTDAMPVHDVKCFSNTNDNNNFTDIGISR